MQCAHDPLYDIDPRTGATIEVFYADRALETFGRWRSWLVLAITPARLLATHSANRSLPH